MGKGQHVTIEIIFSPAFLQPTALFTPPPEARLPRSQALNSIPWSGLQMVLGLTINGLSRWWGKVT